MKMNRWPQQAWITLLMRGALAIVFGVLVLFWPVSTLIALVLLWGGFAAADGVFMLLLSIGVAREGGRWWSFLLGGVVGVVVGVVAIAHPGLTSGALIALMAGWALVTGALGVLATAHLRRVIAGEWRFGLESVLSITFGVALLVLSSAGALALLWLIAIYAIASGLVLLSIGAEVRHVARHASATA
jgi:uncharacterized membrane protein HdeD (DUF308 family)